MPITSLTNVRSNASSKVHRHLESVLSNREERRSVNPLEANGDVDLLAQIGYKQEMQRHYTPLQIFAVSFSVMGVLPSITISAPLGMEGGPVGLVWGWFCGGFFVMFLGVSLSFIGSAFPTAGGLFYTANIHSSDKIRVPLSFLIACSNFLAWACGLCALTNGCTSELFAAIQIGTGFEATRFESYGVFVGLILSMLVISYFTTQFGTHIQSLSTFLNLFIAALFIVAVPVGFRINHGILNDGSFVFGHFENTRTWGNGWCFMLCWMPIIYTLGAMDGCIHMSEECKNPSRNVPIGIISSVFVIWIVGWVINILIAACMLGKDTTRYLNSPTGMVVAQILVDSLGKTWAVAFMVLIFATQYLMAMSLLVALSRQIYGFARDNGFPFVYKQMQKLDPRFNVPVNAIILACCTVCIIALLTLIGNVAAQALFTLAIVGNLLAWFIPILLITLPTERGRSFKPGAFYFSRYFFYPVNIVTCCWLVYSIILCMFPDGRKVSKENMNYTCVISGGAWIFSMVYFFAHGYKHYHGPKSNLVETLEAKQFDLEDGVDSKSEVE